MTDIDDLKSRLKDLRSDEELDIKIQLGIIGNSDDLESSASEIEELIDSGDLEDAESMIDSLESER